MDLGRVRVMQKKLDEGLEEFSTALQLDPNNPEIHFSMAFLLEQMGRRKQAITHYREALRFQPDFEEARKRLASLEK